MALNSMDDKILGEKVQYYCSSSEDEEEVNSDEEEKDKVPKTVEGPRSDPFHQWDGKAVHTGFSHLYTFVFLSQSIYSPHFIFKLLHYYFTAIND